MLGQLLQRVCVLLRTSLGVLLARFSTIALFALTARLFSQHDEGQFIYAITLPQLLIQLGTLGWLNLIRREVARRTEMPPSVVKGFVERSIQVPMIAVLLLSAGLVLYAAFGMGGLCLFAVLGPLLLWMLDLLGRRIRAAPLRATFLAVVGMNGVFLNQIALQTALLTYGLAVVPLLLFVLDRVLCRIWCGRGEREGGDQIGQAGGASGAR